MADQPTLFTEAHFPEEFGKGELHRGTGNTSDLQSFEAAVRVQFHHNTHDMDNSPFAVLSAYYGYEAFRERGRVNAMADKESQMFRSWLNRQRT